MCVRVIASDPQHGHSILFSPRKMSMAWRDSLTLSGSHCCYQLEVPEALGPVASEETPLAAVPQPYSKMTGKSHKE